MTFTSRILATVVSTTILPLALVLFASGFFPYKPFLPGLATFGADENGSRPPPVFDRVILLVIDALRSDFVYSNHSGFEFTQGLIRNGAAVPFTAHASSPTVTMPRVKAITTGSVPSFVDVILNFAESDTMSSLANQDTWLAQLKARPGGKLVMYGDDTWLNLFPGMFDRYDGTSSFFVSDFTEVDNNVTRHVPDELQMTDWTGMIMHYLGLDHIGHKSGPNSPHMLPKQREMDGIVRDIYTAIDSVEHLGSTLLVLCGDHGMNDAGNHGGASPGEVSPALTFISPKLQSLESRRACPAEPSETFQYYQTVEQSDIAPTLAGLLGFPVPRNNLGVFIPDFLPLWSQASQRLQLLSENARQILEIAKGKFSSDAFTEDSTEDPCERPTGTDLADLQCKWQRAVRLLRRAETEPEIASQAESALLAFSKSAQEIMSSAASNYNVNRLYQGAIAATVAVIVSGLACFPTLRKAATGGAPFFGILLLSYGGLMFASSYVEEEQQFWYWMLSGWQCYLYLRPGSKKGLTGSGPLFLAVLSRIARRWNQTGQKFAAEPDIARTFLTQHPNILWILILITYSDVYQRLRQENQSTGLSRLSRFLYLPLTSFAFIFKLCFTAADSPELLKGTPLLGRLAESVSGLSLLIQARVIFSGIGVAFLGLIYLKQRSALTRAQADFAAHFHDIVTVFLVTQARATNIPLFAIFRFQQRLLNFMDLSDLEITVTSLLMQYTSFFALGGSNSIASIDLSNAYNGVSSYNVIMVGILTFVNNWSGPIWWVSATYCLFRSDRRRASERGPRGHIEALTLFAAVAVLGIMVACTVLRTHLFIWTVFSPKFLYSAAWALGQHVVVNLLWGEGFLRWMYI